MKILLGLIIAATVLFAQSDDFFTKWKASMSEGFKTMLPSLQEARDCVAKADSASEAKSCIDTHKRKMDQMNGSEDGEDTESDLQLDDSKPWNKQTRNELLTQFDESIHDLKIILQCAEESQSFDSFITCQKKHGIKDED